MKPGIYSLTMEAYQADPCPEPSLTRSAIRNFINGTPAQVAFNHPRLNPNFKEEKPKEAFDIGTVAHSLLLEGLDVACIIDADDWRKKEAKELRDQARADGQIPMLSKQWEEVSKMVRTAQASIANNPNIPVVDLVMEGLSEPSVIWQEGKTWLRCRPDWWSEGTTVIDYKTTSIPGGPEAFTRSIIQNGLDIQESLYRRGIKAIKGFDVDFLFMVQETFEPYACFFVALPPQFKEIGRQKVETGIRMWEWCMAHNEWPGYSDQIYYPDPQPWAIAQWEERRFGLEIMTQGEL